MGKSQLLFFFNGSTVVISQMHLSIVSGYEVENDEQCVEIPKVIQLV